MISFTLCFIALVLIAPKAFAQIYHSTLKINEDVIEAAVSAQAVLNVMGDA